MYDASVLTHRKKQSTVVTYSPNTSARALGAAITVTNNRTMPSYEHSVLHAGVGEFVRLTPMDYHVCCSVRVGETAMLLVSCPGCHIEISGRPDLCSNCGAPLGEAFLKQCKLWLKIGKILAGLGIILVIWSIIGDVISSLRYVGWLMVILGLIFTIWAQYILSRRQG